MAQNKWSHDGATLYLGDSYIIARELGGGCVSMIIADPPYDWDGVRKHAYHKEFMRLSRGAVAVFAPPENQWWPGADQWLFWVKPTSTKNTIKRYSRFVEIIHMYKSVGTLRQGRHWSQYTNVFYDLVDDKLHPHDKPLSLMIRLIKNHTERGDTILDPFMGSGTSGVACAITGRKFIGIEIDSTYFEIAKERILAELERYGKKSETLI